MSYTYCWWTKSCTTWNERNPFLIIVSDMFVHSERCRILSINSIIWCIYISRMMPICSLCHWETSARLRNNSASTGPLAWLCRRTTQAWPTNNENWKTRLTQNWCDDFVCPNNEVCPFSFAEVHTPPGFIVIKTPVALACTSASVFSYVAVMMVCPPLHHPVYQLTNHLLLISLKHPSLVG